MTNSTEALDLAQIVFYAAAAIPGIFCLIKHGIPGLPGWLYVLAMCGLRLAGSGMAYTALANTGKPSATAQIISSIGLSPLLLSALGIMHEANYSVRHSLPFYLGPISLLFPHIVVLAGIALSAASKGKSGMVEGGIIVFLTAWIIMVAVCGASYKAKASWSRHDGEKKLLQAMFVALPLIGVRVIYGVAIAFKEPQTRTGSLPVQVIFGTLPEFLTMITYLVAGIMTRNLAKDRKESLLHPEQIEARHENA